MHIKEIRLANIKLSDENDNVIYDGLTEDLPQEYKDIHVKITNQDGKVVELKIDEKN